MNKNVAFDEIGMIFPDWFPLEILIYLAHEKLDLPQQQISREIGLHVSKISRIVRAVEKKKSDPVFLSGLQRAESKIELCFQSQSGENECSPVTKCDASYGRFRHLLEYDRDRRRTFSLLTALDEPGAFLAVSMDLSVVVATNRRQNVFWKSKDCADILVVEFFALAGWIKQISFKNALHYRLTSEARSQLINKIKVRRCKGNYLAESYSKGVALSSFRPQTSKSIALPDVFKGPNRVSPLTTLARLKDRCGKPFLSNELVAAGQMLREDFELAKLDLNSEEFSTVRNEDPGSRMDSSSKASTTRLKQALSSLGPELSDVVLRCCCNLQGMKEIENDLGWSARSAKVVLRIALLQLSIFYKESELSMGPRQKLDVI